ncbi:uncharacterized protein CIMG_07083 [Coccidioides immitis RS]|uniref:MFS monocarboxylate transporter n=1 Tax=Coccidioides immitis (strain RS) TaxID=246410 RepID=J3K9L1_COCIM|nr:uncharacterized protein CIMG_07083 [Coccidioides immitis RS]EAS31604.3 hypothetical protein CIMG_07083 [Coccidioides immitis RS]
MPSAVSSASSLEQEKRDSPEPPPIVEQTSKVLPPGGPSPPPNGGLSAWLHVAGSFMLYFNSWGILNAFGVYQTYYESGSLFSRSSSDISWIGSIQAFMVLLAGILVGPFYDRGYLRPLLLVGTFGLVFGHMMLSICNAYWQVLLAQGFCIGIGAGCLFVPCVSILPTYFSTKLGLAVGLAASGSSLGGIIYPIILHRLIDRVGFGWSVRVIGFLALGTLLFPLAAMRLRVKPPKARSFIDWTAFTDAPYMFFVIASFIAFMGLFTQLFFLSFFTENRHIASTEIAFYIVPIFNAASCLGRSVPNAIADKTGPFNLISPGAIISGVLILCTIAVTNKGGLIVIALLSGFISGILIGMPPLCFVILTKDKTKIGTRVGMAYAIIGFGVLAGGPGGGRILGTQNPLGWTGLWIFGGVSLCVAGFMYAGLRVAHRDCQKKVLIFAFENLISGISMK